MTDRDKLEHYQTQARAAMFEEMREALDYIVRLADEAMKDANRDGAEYDRQEELRTPRFILARADAIAKGANDGKE